MRRYWLVFSQSVTVLLAAYFVISTLKPQWLGSPAGANATAPATVLLPPAPTAATAPVQSSQPAPGSLRAAAQLAARSVVSINTRTTVQHPFANDPFFQYFFGQPQGRSQSGLGSGVIASSDGYLLTNNHVIEGADSILVTLHDGREFPAQVIGTDPESDLAVLKINARNLPAIHLGNSDQLAIGDSVLAIGNPFGIGQTVTSGIISALGRSHLGLNIFENFIQTDAAINPGNSGGALVDINGHLVGINTAIYSRSGGSMGIGFAIPAATAQFVLESLVREGRVTRGWLGLAADPLTPELAQAIGAGAGEGVIVTGVLQGGPAARAGIRPGDIIQKVGEHPVRNVPELLTRVTALRPGQSTALTLLREGKPRTLAITPEQRPHAQRTLRQR
ncbi:PDZ domain-containing protein [Allofranklinella schreckenbergeri]|uniref:PDZ domain-containing protein n=1 Tax=Allofranklinella schreckenbergeri TaxID=1076744 RepID=A0A3M6R6X1_9BURK|nr:trypsin-like peptidase domain-containing protein [Allofranklinella schreckenbergeri]RMX11033.1 PDZ domain-containing protein [Allofranklinella schreckenbergeri]